VKAIATMGKTMQPPRNSVKFITNPLYIPHALVHPQVTEMY